MASHKSKRLKRNIVFLYLSLLVAILTFFTVYAYRFDVLSQLHENNYVDFSVSEVKQKAIEQQFYKYEFNNENMSHFKEILENELVDYTITISYFSVDDEESDLYYAYGRGPYEENTKYAQDFNINSDGKEITIVAYPTFRRYFTYYRTFAFVIALVCGSVCFLLLYRGKIAERIVNLWKKMKKKYEYRLLQKLSIKMIVANIFAIIIAFSLYTFIYTNRYSFFEFVSDTFYLRQDFSEEVSSVATQSKHMKMSKKNKKEMITIIDTVFDDDRSEVYIYKENGLYYAGGQQEGIASKFYYSPTTNVYSINAIRTPSIYTYALPFKEQVGMLLIYSYPLINYAQPFQYVVLLVAFSIYLLIMLYCIQAKIITIKKIQEDISILASGDLAHEIQVADNDELGDLANHLNQMRVSFLENIESEKEARNANRDLISAMSHDLRTPLTTLNGYLEIVQLEKGDKKKREEYIKRCLNKVEEISDLSNKMFEYSLVFSNDDNVEMQYVNGKDIKQVLEDHIQYLKVLGFHVQSEYINCESMVYVNMMMFKRIFNNLFSNIQKYADKSEDVIVLCTHKKDQWKFVLANAKNKQVGQVESNRIGLKSVRKIVALHHGECYINDSDDQFRVIITIPMEE